MACCISDGYRWTGWACQAGGPDPAGQRPQHRPRRIRQVRPPAYRHSGREVPGQMLFLAVDFSTESSSVTAQRHAGHADHGETHVGRRVQEWIRQLRNPVSL